MSFRVTITLTNEEGRALVDRALEATATERAMVQYTTLAGRWIRERLVSGNVAGPATTPADLAPRQCAARIGDRRCEKVAENHSVHWCDGSFFDTETDHGTSPIADAALGRLTLHDVAHAAEHGLPLDTDSDEALAAAQRTLRANRIANGLDPDTGKPAAFIATAAASGGVGPDSERRKGAR